MQFTSISYLFFLFVLLMAIAATARYKNARWILMLAGSYFFYLTWQPVYVLLLIFTTAVGYFSGIRIAAATDMKTRRQRLRVGVLLILVVLFLFKYSEVINGCVFRLLNVAGHPSQYNALDILLPIGISFYTFQVLSYLFDVYYMLRKEERHFGYLATYVASFPQLLSGPIERSKAYIDQLSAAFVSDRQRTIIGLRRIAWGLFKKLVVADRIGYFADHVFNMPSAFHSAPLIFATVIFAFQLYFDFSGYADIAIGSARVLGIDISENFDRPFSSKSVTEFWRRWHITLGTWLRDYVYKPFLFGRKKWKDQAVYAALFLTFFLCGLWHGPKWTYLIFGTMQGVAMIMEMRFAAQRKKASHSNFRMLYFSLSWLATFLFILLSNIFFRANTTQDSFYIVREIFTGSFSITEIGAMFSGFRHTHVVFSMILLVSLIISDRFFSQLSRGERTFGSVTNTLVYACMVVAILIWGDWGATKFLYLQF